MHIIPDTQIVKPTEQWSPYPEGTNAVACTETMKSIDYAASFFMDIAPGDAPPMDPRIRFGETVPISMGFTPAICEDSAIMRARDWLESDGIPEAIGTDDEDTKPCAPRASEPIYPGQSLAW